MWPYLLPCLDELDITCKSQSIFSILLWCMYVGSWCPFGARVRIYRGACTCVYVVCTHTVRTGVGIVAAIKFKGLPPSGVMFWFTYFTTNRLLKFLVKRINIITIQLIINKKNVEIVEDISKYVLKSPQYERSFVSITVDIKEEIRVSAGGDILGWVGARYKWPKFYLCSF